MAAERYPELRPDLAGAIYGTILATAVVAAASEKQSLGAWDMAVSVVATSLVFWLAHVYADVLARGLHRERHVSWRSVRAVAGNEWPMIEACVPVVIPLLLAAVGLFSRDTGVTLALIVGVAALVAWGVAVGRSRGLSTLGVAIAGVLNGAFGGVIVGLKVLVH